MGPLKASSLLSFGPDKDVMGTGSKPVRQGPPASQLRLVMGWEACRVESQREAKTLLRAVYVTSYF